MAKWSEVRMSVNNETSEAVANFLFELGSTGVRQTDNEIIAYFSNIAENELRNQINDYVAALVDLGLTVNVEAEISGFADQDWNAEWKRHFKPIYLTEGIVVKPSWEEFLPTDGSLVIEIDPGQAFGTGHHATTSLMVRFLEKYIQPGCSVLDVGTGTGILAIAAAKLGCGKVFAFDNDTIAINAAKKNVMLNDLASRVKLSVATPNSFSLPESRFELVLANITKSTIFRYFDELSDFVKPSGLLIVSGILLEEKAEIAEQVDSISKMEIIDGQAEGEWTAFAIRKG